MKVQRIILKNVMGIESLEITPGRVTTISGKNATGKSSIMAGITSLISGGHDAFLLRQGEEEGEAVIVFDNDTVLTKKITASKSPVAVEVGGHKVSSPASYVKELFGSGFNPVAFISLPEKDKMAALLGAVAIDMDVEKLEAITGAEPIKDIEYLQHPLQLLDDIERHYYDARTGVNRIASDARKTADTLRGSLINVPESADAEIAKLEAAIEKTQLRRAESKEKLSDIIQELSERKAKEIEAINQKYSELIDEERSCTAEIDSGYVEDISAHNTKLYELVKTKDLAKRQAYVKEQITELSQKHEAHESESADLSAKIDQIKKLRADLASKVKVGGHTISVENGKLAIDGLPYEKLNTAAKVRIAMIIAEKNLGKARFVAVDGAEALDHETLGMISDEAMARDIQLLMFSVSDAKQLVQETKGGSE